MSVPLYQICSRSRDWLLALWPCISHGASSDLSMFQSVPLQTEWRSVPAFQWLSSKNPALQDSVAAQAVLSAGTQPSALQ